MRPNSPHATTSVVSSKPRSCRSLIVPPCKLDPSVAKSRGGANQSLAHASHQRRSTVTSRTPASTNRRASNIRWLQAGAPQRVGSPGSNAGAKPHIFPAVPAVSDRECAGPLRFGRQQHINRLLAEAVHPFHAATHVDLLVFNLSRSVSSCRESSRSIDNPSAKAKFCTLNGPV